ncbi:MAG: DUF4364 family protein [Clostridia bacterium]|nr:DUF4364 family protein [Clostridia bacterium]
MKKNKDSVLNTMMDIKVFLLFLLDNIAHPVDHTTLMTIIMNNVDVMSFDYEECLRELVDSEHLYYDEVDGERYYMISDKGRFVASELYDNLDADFRERSLRLAIKHISLTDSGASLESYITEAEANRFRVTLVASDKYGEIMRSAIVVNSRSEAERIKQNFENRPDGVYRGIFFASTGRLEYFT